MARERKMHVVIHRGIKKRSQHAVCCACVVRRFPPRNVQCQPTLVLASLIQVSGAYTPNRERTIVPVVQLQPRGPVEFELIGDNPSTQTQGDSLPDPLWIYSDPIPQEWQ